MFKSNPVRVTFPWLSSSLALFSILLFILSYEGRIQAYLGVSLPYVPLLVKGVLLVTVISAMIWDWRRIFLTGIQISEQTRQLQGQIDELWQQKKQVQRKAHTYSAHTDKLKLFISDKLLEYIEYDEKFLHFKSIAAEVRHNGVISYDKVMTVLESLNEQYIEPWEDNDETVEGWEEVSSEEESLQADAREALECMRYLWDLLDLSTADNIALHINNHLCDCEEQYYSMMLNPDQLSDFPVEPDFNPKFAVTRTVSSLLTGEWTEYESDVLELLDDDHLRVYLRSTGNLLGNENHLVLLLENLIKNAQFYSDKKAFRNQHNKIFIGMSEYEGTVSLEVYNRGPHIDAEHQEHIFQLGYSTRRVKENHGKGLGLYFVNEIVKGYEGRIAFENIYNKPMHLNFVFIAEGGELQNRAVQLDVAQGKPIIEGNEEAKSLKWEFDATLQLLEVNEALSENKCSETFESSDSKEYFYDPFNYSKPSWVLQITWERRKTKIVFTPLNIEGVSFFVQLPTAHSRLDGIEHDWEEAIDYEQLNKAFHNPENEVVNVS